MYVDEVLSSGSASSAAPALARYDQLVAVDGALVLGMTFENAIALIKVRPAAPTPPRPHPRRRIHTTEARIDARPAARSVTGVDVRDGVAGLLPWPDGVPLRTDQALRRMVRAEPHVRTPAHTHSAHELRR